MKKILFVTGKRGGFEACVPTLELFRDSLGWDLSIFACDMHGQQEFGLTIGNIDDAGFSREIWKSKNDYSPRRNTLVEIHSDFVEALGYENPDVVLLIGDRGEQLVAAVAAQQAGCFIAHIEGGDVTGTLDDSARHAITKLSHIHFCSTERAKSVLLKLGEPENRIHVVGDVHIDSLKRELDKPFREIEWAKDAIIVLFHPDTDEPRLSGPQFDEIIRGTAGFKRVFIYPCSDIGHEAIIERLELLEKNGETVFRNIPHEDFVMAMRQARCLVGNSSAGVKEAPHVALKSLNLGGRQYGRAESWFIDSEYIRCWLNDDRRQIQICRYGDGRAYERIFAVLNRIDLTPHKHMRHLI